MKRLFLCLFLSVPAFGGAACLPSMAQAAATMSELGDLSAMRTIVADTLAIATSGDLPKAAIRITDFETAWDNAESQLRPLSTEKWTYIDHAADAALNALRANPQVTDTVTQTLNDLLAALDNPGGAATGNTPAPAAAAAFAVTNADGSPVPCEVALAEVRRVTPMVTLADADQQKVADLTNKGIERCNADDDKRADDFFSQILTIMGH